MVGAIAISLATLVSAGHAHNDYEHRRPLFDAVEHGFRSFGADVYLVDGRLLVAHDRKDLKSSRSLESLYLAPLARLVREGSIGSCMLMVDVKADGEAATRALVNELEPYRWMIATVVSKPVTVVVSGAGDRRVIERESGGLLWIDGRPADLDVPRNPRIAWVSDNWSNHFSGRSVDRPKLDNFVKRAHDRGYKLRFWATPEHPQVWRALSDAGVDPIGTDQLRTLAEFLRGARNR